jgi:hypothetical protein
MNQKKDESKKTKKPQVKGKFRKGFIQNGVRVQKVKLGTARPVWKFEIESKK